VGLDTCDTRARSACHPRSDCGIRTVEVLLTSVWAAAVLDSVPDSTTSTPLGDAVGKLTTGSMALAVAWLERRFILVELAIHFFVRALVDGGWGGVGGRR
jgi:hypothetical protein